MCISHRVRGSRKKKRNATIDQRDYHTHVVRKAEHNLGGAVPPRRDVLCHKALLLRLVEPAREPEIANFELAVRVHEQVARLEVAVEHISRVDIFQTAQRLVDERLEVRVREWLTGTDLGRARARAKKKVRFKTSTGARGSAITYDGVEISLHELFVKIYFVKVTIWAKDDGHVVKGGYLDAKAGKKGGGMRIWHESGVSKNSRSCACGSDARALFVDETAMTRGLRRTTISIV